MKNALIINAVPTNNGDAALVFGLRDKLIEKGYKVTISTLKIDIVKKLYPNIEWIKAEYEFNKLERKIIRHIPSLKKKIIKRRTSTNDIYKNIDLIISAPGGYINSYYGIYDRIFQIDVIKKNYKSKVVMYSQSVGPLNSKDKEVLEKNIYLFDLFMARDEISYNNVKEFKNVIKTNDAAFLLKNIESKEPKENKVAISVREWKFDGRSKEKYISLIENMVYKCIDSGYDVEFLSTCQGLSNYVDDSIIAKEIVESLDNKYKKRVIVNDKYYSLEELRESLCRFKFVIGTRLHMCILSMLSGVPAFNISYEAKGKECYKILDLNEYSIDYNDDIDEGMKKLQKFIDKNNDLIEVYKEKVKVMQKEANEYFEYMIEKVIKE